jgi:hypothetical protein
LTYNTTRQGSLVESNSTFCYVEGTNCCGQSTAAVWFPNGQTTCVGLDKHLVEEDMNPCSSTSGTTRTGNLFEANSVDCGYIAPTPTPSPTAAFICDSYTMYNPDQNYDRSYSYEDCDGNIQEGLLGPERDMTFCAKQGTVSTGGSDLTNNGAC